MIQKYPSSAATYSTVHQWQEGEKRIFLTTLLTASVVDARNMRTEHCWNESDGETLTTRGPELT